MEPKTDGAPQKGSNISTEKDLPRLSSTLFSQKRCVLCVSVDLKINSKQTINNKQDMFDKIAKE
jgi:hypothetical protein